MRKSRIWSSSSGRTWEAQFALAETTAAAELWMSELNIELQTRFDARGKNNLFCAVAVCSARAKGESRTEEAVILFYVQIPRTNINTVRTES